MVSRKKIVDTGLLVEEAAKAPDVQEDDIMVTSSGVKIRVKVVPTHILDRVWSTYPEIVPPKIAREDGDKTWEEDNLDDPDYIEAMQQRLVDLSEALNKLYALKGLEIVELPIGMVSFDEDKDWLDEYAAMGIAATFPTRATRYIEWILYRVLASQADITEMQRIATRLMGTDAEEDDTAEERFQRPS